MTQLASLPTLSVQIAFNPSNLQSLTQTWTDVTAYVQDFTTSSGRQHFLDRIESSTLSATLDNRTGYFLNGTTNGTGYVIRTRLPIKVTATTGGITYPVFFGLLESVEERSPDVLNQDLLVRATDNTKYLSLLYMNRPAFWKQYATSANALSWYRCDGTQAMADQINHYTGQVAGTVQNVPGAIYYDTNQGIDLTNGTSAGTNVAYLQLSNPKSTGSLTTQVNGIDFWFVGEQSQSQFIIGSLSIGFQFNVSARGTLAYTDVSGNVQDTNIQIADGNWHHIGIVQWTQTMGGAYPTYIYVDGQYFSAGTRSLPLATGYTPLQIGNYNAGLIAWQPANYYIDEIVITQGVSSLATIQGEVNQRFAAGSLLKNSIASGDRIAEVLTIAGYGTITAGALSVPNYLVDGATWSPSNNGTFYVAGFQSAVTNSAALDLIQQVTDTDIGSFYQNPDGTLEFDSQVYDYTASKNAIPSGANVWTDTDTQTGTTFTYYLPASLSILRDDADLWTTVKITAQNGTVQTYENTANEPLYGYATLTKGSTVHITNEAAYQTAVYLGNLYQSPMPRVQTLELRSETNNGANLVQMLNSYINDEVLVIRNENGADTSGKIKLRMVVESVRHDFKADPGQWHTEFTLDPYPLRGQNQATPTYFMIFDNATYGKYDTTNAYL